jgi:hypothetical protein
MSKRYCVALSNKTNVFISEEEYIKLVNNIDKNFVLLGNEMINPSFIISVTKDINWNDSLPAPREPQKRIIGHIDKERGVYVIDGEEIVEDEVLGF